MKKLILSLALLLAPLAVAHADTITFTLAQPVQTIAGPSDITFDGTLSAPSTNSADVYLNADSYNISGSAILDDSDFYNDAPLSLAPGQTYTGPLFDVDILSDTAGVYTGFFAIQGGSTPDAQSTLAQDTFRITAATTVPEPSSWLLLLTGVLFLAAFWKPLKASAVSRP